jgi:ATP-dependent Clp protease ATP-binding subunit ClpB
VLDDGRLTDGKGRAVNFRNTVEVLAGRFGEGDTIVVEFDGETLRLRKEARAAIAS